jgi:hypothetical protein
MDFDSAVWPCCLVFEDKDLFVPPRVAGKVDIMADWNSASFLTARGFFAGRPEVTFEALPSPCNLCSNAQKWKLVTGSSMY